MFTGIVQDIGEIADIDKKGDWTIAVAAHKLPLDHVAVGASVACSGICLTVIEKVKAQFKVQVSAETLSKTTALHWKSGTRINLEPALRMGDELGGHLVAGHIDGIARAKDRRQEKDSMRYVFELPREFSKFIVPKGSVTLDGVSLTVNEVIGDTAFGVNIIPHTQAVTTFGALEPGGEVNFEVDLLARYVERLMSSPPRGGG